MSPKASSPEPTPPADQVQRLNKRVEELEALLERAFEVGEEAARRSALQYRNLFQHSPVSIWEEDFSEVGAWFARLREAGVTDIRAHFEEFPEKVFHASSLVRITRVNEAGRKLLKLGPEDQLEGSFQDIFKQETRDTFVEELTAIWEGRSRISLEGTGRAADGTSFHYVLNMLVPEDSGRPRLESVVAVITDITELVETREALRRSQADLQRTVSEKAAVLTSIPETVLSVDSKMRLMECNRELEAVCPMAKDLAPGDKVDTGERAKCPWVDVLRDTLRDRVSTTGVRASCEHCGKTPRQLEMSGSPLIQADGSFAGAVLVVRDVTRVRRMEEELKALRPASGMGRMRGKSPAMQKVYALLEQLAQVDSLVLVTGESGTGKELIAESLHYASPRAKMPLIKVNCSALSENLLESELFGHVRGAFSGAVRDKQGRFEAAQGGTLFLDEIGDISSLIQLKLLRAIESKEFERVGESKTRRADVRLVAATNADLKDKVRTGAFREDLYYRLNVVNIRLPALRERREDIPLLTQHFLEEFAQSMDKRITGADPGVMERFLRHTWPGNIRELRHAVEHACILCRGEALLPEHLPNLGPGPGETGCEGAKDPAELTAKDIRKALDQAGGKRAKAARLLGVSRSTLYRRLEEFGLE